MTVVPTMASTPVPVSPGITKDNADSQKISISNLNSNGNEAINSVKKFVDDDLGGEGVLKTVKTTIDGKYVNTKFEVDVSEEGKYYVTAWVMGTNGKKIQAYLDDDPNPIGDLKISENDWQFAELQNKNIFDPIQLSKGTHVFSFRSQEVPAIEFIRLAKQKDKAILPDTNYRNYIKTLETSSLPESYRQSKIGNQTTETMALATISNPAGDYAYQLDTSFTYTYYAYFNFNSGQHVVFETNKSDPYASDPVMYLFNANDPVNGGSWSNDDYNGFQSRIDVTIPSTGSYILLLRSFSSSSPGTSDLYKDGSLYASNVALAGTRVYCGGVSKTGELNYFTAKLTGDSRIWLEDSSSPYPGKITGFNDDYAGSGDFNWGLASRVKKDFSPSINYVLVSSYSSYNPTGKADVYMKCDNSNIMSYFENLKADDAIKSAQASDAYNCISWSGGRIDLGRYFWPPSPGNPWYDPNPLTAFDKFYGNTPARYSGAMNYTRSGATESNSVVDLWALSGSYTHASVTKPGNDHSHGYDWESKPGGLMRTFHPRYALRGSSYGDVVAYYRWTGGYASAASSKTTGGMTFDESVKSGLTVIDKVELSAEEKAKLADSINSIPEEVKREFEAKYLAWKATWDDPDLVIQSNPWMFTQSEQYDEFLAYCKKQGKAVWPLLFQKYVQGDELAKEAIIDVTYTKYGLLLDDIRQESAKERYNTEGAYIAPSEEANIMRYIEKLLALEV
ncbi:DUF7689 domain-containing protein [Methanocella conradii]